LGGYSPLGRKRGDKFGLGWYYVGASNEFGPIPQALFGPRDGTGVETFYSYQVTPWCAITPDVQYLKPEQIKRYNILRGYAEDPCKNIPAGHNPEMYKRHMGCN
jgi:hypothetical protein